MLPEQYQSYALPGQRPHVGEVELRDEVDPIVHVADPYDPNRSVAVRRSALQPMVRPEPRDLTPRPLLDPVAQRLLAGGVGSGIALWGGGQFLAGAGQLVSSLSGVGALLFFLALAGARAMFIRPTAGARVEVHNHVRGFGRSTMNL